MTATPSAHRRDNRVEWISEGEAIGTERMLTELGRHVSRREIEQRQRERNP